MTKAEIIRYFKEKFVESELLIRSVVQLKSAQLFRFQEIFFEIRYTIYIV